MNKLIQYCVMAAVGVLLFASLLIPLTNEATATTETLTNDGFFRMKEITADSDDVTITWSYTDPYVFNVGDEIVKLPAGTTGGNPVYPYTIFANEGWGLRVAVSANDRVDLNLYGSGENSNLLWYATTVDSSEVTITLIGGTATFDNGASSVVSRTYTSVYIPDNNGDYVLKKPTDSVFMTKDSLIYSTGRTSATFGSNVFAINLNLAGNIDNGVNVSVLAPAGFTASNIEVNSSVVSGYIGLYKFDNVTFDITQTSTEITTGAVYSQVIVPYEVTVEKAVHADDSTRAIIGVIPLIVIVGLVAGIVGVIAVRRNA